jgi:hypothetical protein
MARTTLTVDATLTEISPWVREIHDVDPARMAAIVESLRDGEDQWGDPAYRAWDLPPVVAVELGGNEYMIIDGHHRSAAARRLEIARIPAWVVSAGDWQALLDAHFDGDVPSRVMEARDYILCGDVSANDVTWHGADRGA